MPLLATGWLLLAVHDNWRQDWRLWLLCVVTMLLVWRSKLPIVWLLAAGAVLGALGWV